MTARLLLASLALGLAACGQPAAPPAATDAAPATGETPVAAALTVYSARHYDSDKLLYAAFENETGIKVDVRESGAPELLETMKAEGNASPADVIIAADAGTLYRFQSAGFTRAVSSVALEAAIPARLREPGGHWFGLTKRARLIVYDPQILADSEVDTYADLAAETLKGELCVRSGTNIYNLSLMGEMIARNGSEAATTWATGIATNLARPPQGGDTAQIEAVAAGQCAAALVNHYYFVRLATGTPEQRMAVGRLKVSFPDQEGAGTHVNVTAAAVASTAPHADNAVRFIEWLATPAGQAMLTTETKEYPVVAGAERPEGLDLLPAFKESDFALTGLGPLQGEAQAIFDRAGWN